MALSPLLSLSLEVAAYRAGQSIDKLLSALAALLLSAPSFMLALLLMFFLALTLKWLRAVENRDIAMKARAAEARRRPDHRRQPTDWRSLAMQLDKLDGRILGSSYRRFSPGFWH